VNFSNFPANFPVRLELCGAVLAGVVGVMLGGVMHPNLAGDDRPAGPQMIAGSAAARSGGPYDGGATLASYGGQTPDYVTGTDAKKALAWTPERAAASPPQTRDEQAKAARDDLPAISRAAYDADPQPSRAHDYPSLGGPDDDQGGPAITG
jgi:hypothetical protein